MPTAWTTIRGAKKPIKPGDSVKADDFHDKEDYQALVESGAIRDSKYPDDVPRDKSPREHLVSQALARVAEAEGKKGKSVSREELRGDVVMESNATGQTA